MELASVTQLNFAVQQLLLLVLCFSAFKYSAALPHNFYIVFVLFVILLLLSPFLSFFHSLCFWCVQEEELVTL
jgi:hypothetical protein